MAQFPTGVGVNDTWTIFGAPTAWEALASPSDESYVSPVGVAGAVSTVTTTFDAISGLPSAASPPQTTTFRVDAFLRIRYVTGVAGFIAGTKTLSLVKDSIPTTVGTFDIVFGSEVPNSHTSGWRSIRIPTTTTFTNTDLGVATEWGISQTMYDNITAPDALIQISTFRFIATPVVDIPGTGGWHLGPHRHSRPRISDISGLPHHQTDMVKVKDPRHPHYGMWMHPEDLDGIDREPTSPLFSEGDLDEAE